MFFVEQGKEFVLEFFNEEHLSKKTPSQLLFVYSVLHIALHDEELKQKYSQEIIANTAALKLFLEIVNKLGKKEILKAQLESLVLKTGCFLYDQNNLGRNKLMHVAGEGNVRSAYMKYVDNVEKAALQAIDEISLAENKLIAERKRYSKEIVRMQQELNRFKK